MAMAGVHNISAIEGVPGLFISDISASGSPSTLRKYGITHILSLTGAKDLPCLAKDIGIQQLHVDIEDNPYEDLLMSLNGACAWIDNALRSQGNGVLVHCVQGISRSGAIIVAYLMRKQSISYEDAFDLARKSRAIVMPNSGFAEQLRSWEQMGYTIFENAVEGSGTLKTTQRYEDWRANRGILMSGAQEAKQQEIRERMADLAVRYRGQTLRAAEMGEAEISTK